MGLIKRLSFIIVYLQFSFYLIGQSEDSKWIFNAWNEDLIGDTTTFWGPSVLDFSTLPPRQYRQTEIVLDFGKTNAVYCDTLGEIFLYSNGMSIYGPNHRNVFDGAEINYGDNWENLTWPDNPTNKSRSIGFRRVQNAMILPVPEADNRWLHLSHNNENRDFTLQWPDTDFFELKICEIDNDAFGAARVIEKDVTINDRILKNGCLTATKHANGRDWWFLQFNKDTVYTYIVDPTGVRLSHHQVLPFHVYDSGGQSKFNQQGTAFAFYGSSGYLDTDRIQLFYADFDRCTGSLSNSKLIDNPIVYQSIFNNGLEFSPNGRFIYINDVENIYQIDLFEDNPFINPTSIMIWDSTYCDDGYPDPFERRFGISLLGQDNKIYVSGQHQCFYLDVIHEPNKKGLDSRPEQRAIRLPTYHFGTLPTPVAYRLGPLDGSSCDTLGLDNNPISRFWYEQDELDHLEIQFRDVTYFRPENWKWTFGDGGDSSEENPYYEYSTNGIYEVCLTVSNENSSDTSCHELQIGPVSNQDPSRTYDISLFPNPVEDFTRLVFYDYLPEYCIFNLYDAKGERVYSIQVYQQFTLDLSHLMDGVYFYELSDGDSVLKSGKLVKI